MNILQGDNIAYNLPNAFDNIRCLVGICHRGPLWASAREVNKFLPEVMCLEAPLTKNQVEAEIDIQVSLASCIEGL